MVNDQMVNHSILRFKRVFIGKPSLIRNLLWICMSSPYFFVLLHREIEKRALWKQLQQEENVLARRYLRG